MKETTNQSRAGVPPARRRRRQADVAALRPGQAGRLPYVDAAPVRRGRGALLAAALLALVGLGPDAWAQYPPPYPYPYPPPPSAPIGPTVGAGLRNAAGATLAQAGMVRKGANDWGRRANAGLYRIEQFQLDFNNLLWQFQTLRTQFEAVASLAVQLGRPRANNAVSELDAGLNIIGALFPFLESQFNAGTLDRNTSNAILDGTDAVMLSAASAMVEFPVESVAMLARIAATVEVTRRQVSVKDMSAAA